MNNLMNTALLADSYKYSQYAQYRPGTESIFSYVEFRGSDKFTKTLNVGFSVFLQNVLAKPITVDEVDEMEALVTAHGEPFNREGWDYILTKHKGFLPLEIKAAPEGLVIPIKNALVTVENTDPECYWLTSFMETMILPAVWYPATVGTISYTIREICTDFLNRTSDTPSEDIGFMLNDFGFRGVSSTDAAGLGGLAHLAVFKGTDNIPALLTARRFYDEKVAGFSIPAMEHSTVTSWEVDGEKDSFNNMIDTYSKGGIFACVIDSYDTYGAIENIWLNGGLLAKVKAAGARVVLRPDSGDPTVVPVEVIEMLLNGLADEVTLNSKGYRVLPPYVRVIQGDGVNERSIAQILANLEERKISASNIVFGMGGKLLQADIDRDTLQAAMKCSSTTVDGREIDVFKQPKTDTKKNSKRGRITLVRDIVTGEYSTIRISELDASKHEEVLQLVYRNGDLFNVPTLQGVRELVDSQFTI
ncbi:nicotinamide phosphoribosyl transferase [Xanthomonas phage Xoo-sp13]|nr:nicotinamide phosphoribosyl transferase [Xanthomonas phage Xoo-sp13]